MAHEANVAPNLQTSTGIDNRKLLMWLFLASECLFFGGLIGTYLLYRDRSIGPPFAVDTVYEGVTVPGLYDIPFTSVSTFVLLMSSVSMVLALAAVQRNDRRGTMAWLMCTSLLGIVFLAGQAFEFTEFYHEGLELDTNLFGSSFYVLTGFHGAHVSVGVLILLSLWAMAARGRLGVEQSLNVELAGLYWHFVDIVWIVIFTLIYLLP